MKKYITKKEKGFVQISNSILSDPNISLKAKTVLAIMLSLPDNWDFSIEGISGKCKESKDCIAKAVNELIDAGYVIRTKTRGADGRITKWEYEVFEEPCKTIEQSNEELEAGMVIRTDPERGNRVPKGSKIKVYVSTGEEATDVDIPNVVGEPIAQAKERLEDAGLNVVVENVNLTPADNYQPKDYVLRQDPQGGTKKVPEGTSVTIYVSSGLYETDIQISLPKQFTEKVCSVSLWLNGTCIKTSQNLNLDQVNSYTFTDITSTNKTENYIVMIKGENGTSQDYMTITVDFVKEKNNVTVTSKKTFESAPPSSADSQSQNESDNNSSEYDTDVNTESSNESDTSSSSNVG